MFTGVHWVPGPVRCAETMRTWDLAARGLVIGLRPVLPAAIYWLVCSMSPEVAGEAETEGAVLRGVPVSMQPSSPLSCAPRFPVSASTPPWSVPQCPVSPLQCRPCCSAPSSACALGTCGCVHSHLFPGVCCRRVASVLPIFPATGHRKVSG